MLASDASGYGEAVATSGPVRDALIRDWLTSARWMWFLYPVSFQAVSTTLIPEPPINE
jgi:hypothetical protein